MRTKLFEAATGRLMETFPNVESSLQPEPKHGGDIIFSSGKGFVEPGGKRWPDGVIRFRIGDEEVLTVDHEGIVYNGVRVIDSGEAHRVVLDFFNRHFICL